MTQKAGLKTVRFFCQERKRGIIMKLSFVGFDLDGTLVNTLDDLHYATNYALSQQNLPQITLDQTRKFVGNGVVLLLQRASGSEDPAVIDRLHQDFNIYYADHCTDHVKPYPGVPEAVAFLKQAGVKIAVLTNKPDEFVSKILSACYPKGSFDIMLGQTSRFPTKPNPESLFYLMQQLGLSKDAAGAYAGDSDVDIHTAKNAGLISISCAWGFRPKEQLLPLNPDYLVGSGKERESLFRQLL